MNKGRLALKIKDGERIFIGDVAVQCKIDGARIRVYIEADKSIPVVRETAKIKEAKKR